jgi:ADP-ribose pyrophosphatase YjhB (NUDIX family)
LTQTILSCKDGLLRYYQCMHHIQRKILEKLLYAEALTYAAMRPAGVESNHYAYHLDCLLKDGFILKKDKQYTLSPHGLSAIDRLSHVNMAERIQPHIVTVIDVTDDKGRTAVFKRNFQPYIHRISFPLGKTHIEESIAEAAARELLEKTSLQDIQLQQRGIVYLTSLRDGTRVSKILCHIFAGTVTGTPPIAAADSKRGEALWVDHTTLKPTDCMPGFHAIKQLLADSPDFFFAEITEAF